MIEQDTIRLLRECDAGVKMGVATIDEVIDKVHSGSLKNYLIDYKSKNQELQDDIQILLDEYHDDGKDPSIMAKGMSWFKTNVMLAANESDNTISDLITDGCNMGVKFLHKYMNQYKAADEKSKNIAKRLADTEEKLAMDIRSFL